MKLWLDDVRPAPNGWVHVENYEQAVDLLVLHQDGGITIEVASLDHDLGMVSCKSCRQAQPDQESWEIVQDHGCVHGEKTGYDVVCWMEENNVWPERVIIHSHNPAGAARMLSVAERHTRAMMCRYQGGEI